jgi:hypothetical protein
MGEFIRGICCQKPAISSGTYRRCGSCERTIRGGFGKFRIYDACLRHSYRRSNSCALPENFACRAECAGDYFHDAMLNERPPFCLRLADTHHITCKILVQRRDWRYLFARLNAIHSCGRREYLGLNRVDTEVRRVGRFGATGRDFKATNNFYTTRNSSITEDSE